MNVEGKKKFDGIGYRVSDETNMEIRVWVKKNHTFDRAEMLQT